MPKKPKDVYVVLHRMLSCSVDVDANVKGVFRDYLDAVAFVEKYCNTEMDIYDNVSYLRATMKLVCGTEVCADKWYSGYDKLWIAKSTVVTKSTVE